MNEKLFSENRYCKMRITIIYLVLLISIGISNTSAQYKRPFKNYKDKITKLYGLIDTSGNIVIKPRYTYVYAMWRYDNIFHVQINRKCGVINLNDEFVIPPIYDVMYYSGNTDTLFRVTNGLPNCREVKSWSSNFYYTQGLSGYVDINHDTIIPLIYPHIGEFIDSEQVTEFTLGKFSDRLANYGRTTNVFIGKWGLIDRKGNVVLKDDFYDYIFNMHSRNNLFFAYKGRKSTILNLRGEQLIPLKRRTHEQLM